MHSRRLREVDTVDYFTNIIPRYHFATALCTLLVSYDAEVFHGIGQLSCLLEGFIMDR